MNPAETEKEAQREKIQVSVVVPLHPSHDSFIPDLVTHLSADSSSIESIIVCRSHVGRFPVEKLQRSIDSVCSRIGNTIEVRLSNDPRALTAGQNKNRGWGLAQGRWTAFVDADDRYCSGRLSLLSNIAATHRADMILHHSCSDPREWLDLNMDPGSGSIVGYQTLKACTFPEGIRNREREGTKGGDTNIEVPRGFKPALQGHTLVLTDLRNEFRFSDLRRGEDGQLNRDILWADLRVMYVDLPLSWYRPAHSTTRNSPIRRIRNGLRHRLGLKP